MEATAGRARRATGAPPVRVLEGQAGSDAAAHAMRAYLAELSDRLDIDPSFADAADPAEVTPPRGDFMLVSEIGSGAVIGFGAVHVLEQGLVEIRRMWLKPDVRGRGLGRFLLGSLENRARSLGGRRILLGVNESLVEACGLYRASGYEPVERDGGNPYVTHVFGKVLVGSHPDAST